MNKISKLISLVLVLLFSINAFATKQPYNPYVIGQALGKVSHKSFKAMSKELVKKDFISGFDNTILDKKPDEDNISDKDSYEIGMIIATQYKARLKKMVTINDANSKRFIKGFDSAVASKNGELTAKEKQILKHFKLSSSDEDN